MKKALLITLGLLAFALPVYAGENVKCGDLNSTWNELKVESDDVVEGTNYSSQGFEVQLSDVIYSDEREIMALTWTVTDDSLLKWGLVDASIWKSNDSAVVYYFPERGSDVMSGEKHGLSHLSLCFDESPTGIRLLNFQAQRYTIADWLGWLR